VGEKDRDSQAGSVLSVEPTPGLISSPGDHDLS